uniref:Uncharacterized protein n=1 Tax=Lactuca sativa TaxID=4236 RepID=A0A9R1V1B3_LACSA|nr:hypothetical protein LSAT_V11C700367480 [Lactuca sativa]
MIKLQNGISLQKENGRDISEGKKQKKHAGDITIKSWFVKYESLFKKHIGEISKVNENEVQVEKEIEESEDENPTKDNGFQKAIVLFTPKENQVQHTEDENIANAEEVEKMVVDQTTKNNKKIKKKQQEEIKRKEKKKKLKKQ